MNNDTIDWGQVAQDAEAAFAADINAALGTITRSIQGLYRDPTVPDDVKLEVLQKLGNSVKDRGQLLQLLNGQPLAAPLGAGNNSLGASPAQPTPTSSPADQATIKRLEDGYRDIGSDFGISVPLNNGRVDVDTFRTNLKKASDDKVNQAGSTTSNAPTTPGNDFIKKSEVQGLVATVQKPFVDHHVSKWSRTVAIPNSEFETAKKAADQLAAKVK